MSGTPHLAQCIIRIDNQNAPPELMAAVTEVVVDTSLHMPGMFTLLIQDPELEWVDNPLLDLGKAVEIQKVHLHLHQVHLLMYI